MDPQRFHNSTVVIETLPPGCYYQNDTLIMPEDGVMTGIQISRVPGDVYLENMRYERYTTNSRIRRYNLLRNINGRSTDNSHVDNAPDQSTDNNDESVEEDDTHSTDATHTTDVAHDENTPGTTNSANNSNSTTIENDPNYQRVSINRIRAEAVANFADRVVSSFESVANSISEDQVTTVRSAITSISAMSALNVIAERMSAQEYIYQNTSVPSNNTTSTTNSDANEGTANSNSDTTVNNTDENNDEDQVSVFSLSMAPDENGQVQIQSTGDINEVPESSRNMLQSLIGIMSNMSRQGNESLGNGQGGLTEEEMVENTQTMDGAVHLDSYTELTPESQKICAICHDSYTENGTIRRLNGCVHMFHKDCIDPWLSRHRTCPMCRTAVARSERDSTYTPTESDAVPNTSMVSAGISTVGENIGPASSDNTENVANRIPTLVNVFGNAIRQITENIRNGSINGNPNSDGASINVSNNTDTNDDDVDDDVDNSIMESVD